MLQCSHLTLGYEGSEVIKDLSFKVKQGDFLLIVGGNGSGKSTLLKGILGLLRPKSGVCDFSGMKATEIGYLPQQTPIRKDFPASVSEVAITGCLNRHRMSPFYGREEKAHVSSMLQKLGIYELRNKPFAQLSGGQRQRVLLCRAMLATSKLLVLDEPAAGLDPASAAQMYELLHQMNTEENVTIMMISHDIREGLKYCSRILHLDGEAHFFENVEEYQNTLLYRKLTGGESLV